MIDIVFKQGVIEAEKKTSNSYVIHGRDLMQPWYFASFLPFLRRKENQLNAGFFTHISFSA